MTEPEIIEHCEVFAAEHGLQFVVEVELEDHDEDEPARMVKSVAQKLERDFIAGSELLHFEARHKEGGDLQWSIALAPIMEHAVALEIWFKSISQSTALEDVRK